MKLFYSVAGRIAGFVILGGFVFGPVQAYAQGQLYHAEATPTPYKQPIEANPVPSSEVIENMPSATTDLFEQQHKDKTAIFLLYEIGVELKEDYSYVSRTHKRVKLLNDSGKDLGEVPIPYDKDREKVTKLEACVITPDGEKHTNTEVQDYNIYEGLGMYSDAMVKIVSLPQVGVGAILDYAVEMAVKKGRIEDAFCMEYHFDYSLPMKEVIFTFTYPKSMVMQYKEYNLEYKPTITETETTITYSWHLYNIYKKSRSESYIPPPRLDNINNIVQFSSIESWAAVSDWYYSLAQKNLKTNKAITKAAKNAAKGHTTIRGKTRAVLEYIQTNFRYVSMSFGDNALAPHPTDQVFRNKYGDCKDLSLLCLAMLDIVGVDSYLALFNDEFSITDPQHELPYPTLFDHALLLVTDQEKGDFYIDPLLKGYDIGEYPLSYQQAYTFVITPDGGHFDRLPVFDEERTFKSMQVVNDIRPNGSAILDITSLWALDFAVEMREFMNKVSRSEKKEFFERLDASYGEVLKREWIGIDNRYGRIKSHLIHNKQDMYPVTDDMIIITITDAERPVDFIEEERQLPIFYYLSHKNILTSVYKIPEGFRVSHIPNNLEIDIGFFKLSRTYEHNNNKITVTQTASYKRTELPVEEYPRVKKFFDEYPKKVNQRIVLKKTKPLWDEIKDVFARFIVKE